MSAPIPQSPIRNPQPPLGFSVLDLLIALFVLTLVLLAAVKQFSSYQQPATPPAAQEQPAPGQPSAPPQ